MQKRPIWTAPLGFRESAVTTLLLTVTGFVLQVIAGPFNFYLLRFPANLIILLVILVLASAAGLQKGSVASWLTGTSLASALTLGILMLTLCMGCFLQTQDPLKTSSLIRLLGLSGVTTSWPFILLFTGLMILLPAVCIRQLSRRGKLAVPFILWHFGVFLVLAGSGLGYADMQRYIMHVDEGKTQNRVYALNGKSLELPVSIQLHDFSMEEYDPRLVLINTKSGLPLPEGRPEFFQIARQTPNGQLGKWTFTVDTYYPRAVWSGNEEFKPMEKPGASPAVYVTATHCETGEKHAGWISSGNMENFQHALMLSDNVAMAVTPASPRQFTSDVTVTIHNNPPVRTTIQVNKPLRIGSWMLYQYGYDFKNGRYSDFSSFEIVSDPWLPVVYTGFLLTAAACLILVFRKKRLLSAPATAKSSRVSQPGLNESFDQRRQR